MNPSRGMPRAIWVLGFVSLLMDVSSEIIHSLLPVFMVTSLGASIFMVGLVEGVAEATALIVKVFSGTLSDHWRRRKGLTVFGYALGAVSKPIFALAVSIHWVFAARFIDRIGKGIRGAPRDALIADLAPPQIRGAAYGLRQSLDTVGAFLGPALAIVLMIAFAGDFRTVFWFAVIPAALAVALLVAGVREPETPAQSAKTGWPLRWASLKRLDRAYWWVVVIGGVFMLARFSEAFLILRAQNIGLPDSWAPAVLVLMNVVYALTAYPAGRLADRMDHRIVLAAGLVVLIAADIALARAQGLMGVGVGVVLWGLHMGLTQGLLATMVADNSPSELRGTAFGFFNFFSGIALLIASAGAGLLWDTFGPSFAFYSGAALSTLALLMIGWHRKARRT